MWQKMLFLNFIDKCLTGNPKIFRSKTLIIVGVWAVSSSRIESILATAVDAKDCVEQLLISYPRTVSSYDVTVIVAFVLNWVRITFNTAKLTANTLNVICQLSFPT